MAKKSILSSKKKTLLPVPDKIKKIFDYLRASDEIKTQTQIANDLNLNRSTVRRILLEFIQEEKKYEYIITLLPMKNAANSVPNTNFVKKDI